MSQVWIKSVYGYARDTTCHKMVSALKAMYSSVKSALRLNNNISEYINSFSGVKQGDPCSSILFMMFVNDIIENIIYNIEGIISINDIKFFLLSFFIDFQQTSLLQHEYTYKATKHFGLLHILKYHMH